MPDPLSDLQTRAKKLKETQSARNEMYDAVEEIYLIQDGDLPNQSYVKKSYSADGRNALQGMTRMLGGTNPKWSVPAEYNNAETDNLSSMLERLAMACWVGSCRVQRKLVHKEACLSAGLYSEIHIAVKSTKTIAAAAGVNQLRADAALQRTPVLFEVLPARACYAEYDSLGLAGHLQYKKARVGAILAAYGTNAETVLEGKERSELVDMSEWWDENNHAVWLGDAGEQIVLEDNPYGYIPIAAAIAEGSDLFQKADQQTRQPLLYGMWKSGSWKAKNLAETALRTTVFNFAATSQLVFKTSDDSPLNVDYSVPGGVITIKPNETLEPLGKIVDQNIGGLIQMLAQDNEESTIYKQALGQAPAAAASFSQVSLLSQQGRQALVIYHRVLSFVLGDAMQIALKIIKEDGIPKGLQDSKGKIELKASDIPDTVEIECNMEIDQPTDERQNAMLATQLAGGEDPILAKETVAKRYLQVEQYDEEVKKIWKEKYQALQSQMAFQQAMAQMQQQMQQQQMQQMQGQPGMGQPGMPPGMPPQGMPPQGQPMPGPEQGLPPELAAQMQGAPGAGLPAMPMTGPMETGAEQGLPGSAMEQMQGGF
jgi:hypothetical protein